MTISYAGVAVGDSEASEVGPWIYANVGPQGLFPLASQQWPGSLSNGPILNNTAEIARPVVINSLFWPRGASRFARGHFVVSSGQLDQIRRNVFRNGVQEAAKLVFSDGENSIDPLMWMLPAIPLQQAVPGAYLWLLTLVDDRYWWWGDSFSTSVTPAVTTWADLYDDIEEVLGETIEGDPVSANYSLPSIDYVSEARPLPAIFDAIAWSVGQRVVRDLDGTVSVQNFSTADATVTSNLAAGWTRYAGGQFDFEARTANDLATLPESVTVAFPATGVAAPSSNFLEIDVALADLGLADFNNIVGSPWSKLLHRYDGATYGSSGPATNLATLTTIAEQMATDWYNWQLGYLDQYFSGVADWTMDGLHDVEWRQAQGRITTRVMRGEFNPMEDLLYWRNTFVSSIIAHTSATFVIPAVAGTVAVTITSAVDTSIWMLIGQTIEIDDGGTHRVYGWISAIADSTHFTLTLTRVAIGSVGNTMAVGAAVIISGDPAALTTATTIITSPATGTATGPALTFAMGTSGNDLAWSAATSTVTLNVPDASTSARGVFTTGTQSLAGAKTLIGNYLWAVEDATGLGRSSISPGLVSAVAPTPGFTAIFLNSLPRATFGDVAFLAATGLGAFAGGTPVSANGGALMMSAEGGSASPRATLHGIFGTLPAFAIGIAGTVYPGVYGTDPVGNVVKGGIITTIGGVTVATGGGVITGTSSGTNTGDQLTFKTIAVSGQSDVVADTGTDTLTLAGSGVTITTDPTTDTITFTVSASAPTAGINTAVSGSAVSALAGTISPTALAADTNNWNPTSFSVAAPTTSIIRASVSSAVVRQLTGLTAGANGQVVFLMNVGASGIIEITNENGSSSAANRFVCGSSFMIAPGQSMGFRYSTTSSRWEMIGWANSLRQLLDSNIVGCSDTATASPATGSLIVGDNSSPSVWDALAVGAVDGDALVIDSTATPFGIKWGTPGTGGVTISRVVGTIAAGTLTVQTMTGIVNSVTHPSAGNIALGFSVTLASQYDFTWSGTGDGTAKDVYEASRSTTTLAVAFPLLVDPLIFTLTIFS